MPFDVVQYELGTIGNSGLSFTDATTGWGSDGVARPVLYSAAAEASPDATRDGEVVGSAIGGTGRGATAAPSYVTCWTNHLLARWLMDPLARLGPPASRR
jgi:hypothetical protein